jgi:hypothetical protein
MQGLERWALVVHVQFLFIGLNPAAFPTWETAGFLLAPLPGPRPVIRTRHRLSVVRLFETESGVILGRLWRIY